MSFQYTLSGGPIDGKKYGPFPENVKDSPNVDKILEGQPMLHVAYLRVEGQARKRVAGMYIISKEGENYVGTHQPSSVDVW